MNYTFHQLRVFLEVVRQESVTKAAEEMHMTQPALSIQLKNFQQQFDIPLTEIIGKKLFVTEFGKKMAELAENVLQEAEQIKYQTAEYRGLMAGKLKISAASTGKYVIPYFLSGFLRQYPGVDLELDVTNKTLVINSLKANSVDFALVSVLPDDMRIEEESLLENRLYVVGNKKEFDAEQTVIYREAGSATRKVTDNYLNPNADRKKIELMSNEAVKQAVIAGLGYSVLPLIGIRNELANGQLFILPFDSMPVKTLWRLVYLKGKKLSPIASAFLKYVQEHKQDIVQTYFDWYLNFR